MVYWAAWDRIADGNTYPPTANAARSLPAPRSPPPYRHPRLQPPNNRSSPVTPHSPFDDPILVERPRREPASPTTLCTRSAPTPYISNSPLPPDDALLPESLEEIRQRYVSRKMQKSASAQVPAPAQVPFFSENKPASSEKKPVSLEEKKPVSLEEKKPVSLEKKKKKKPVSSEGKKPSSDEQPAPTCPSAKILSHPDLLRPIKLERDAPRANALSTVFWVRNFRQRVRHFLNLLFLRPNHNRSVDSVITRRRILFFLFLLSHSHYAVQPIRACYVWCLLRCLSAPAAIFCPVFWAHLACSVAFEFIMHCTRIWYRRMRHDIPHYIAGISPRAKLPLLKFLFLVSDHQLSIREHQPENSLSIDTTHVRKGLSGPFSLATITPQVLYTKLSRSIKRKRTGPLPEAQIFALSYTPDDTARNGSLTLSAAAAVIEALREHNAIHNSIDESFYLWSHAKVRDSSPDVQESRLLPYLLYPTIQTIQHSKHRVSPRTHIETDLAHARNLFAPRNNNNFDTNNPARADVHLPIVHVTRHLVARRRDRLLRSEDQHMRALLTKLRALSLGMPPSHVTERVWVVANAMRLIGCSLRDDKARVKEMPGAGLDWHGIYEFIDDDPNCPNCSMDHQCSADTYLRSVAMTRTKMYALEQRDRCYVIWIYVDDFRDFVTIFEELEVAEGVARQVLRRVRVTFPKNEEHRLDSIHASTETSQVPPEDIKLLLMRGNIHVNLETSYEMHSDYVRLMRMRKHGVSC